MGQMSFDDLINEKENKYHKNRWYALVNTKVKGRIKSFTKYKPLSPKKNS